MFQLTQYQEAKTRLLISGINKDRLDSYESFLSIFHASDQSKKKEILARLFTRWESDAYITSKQNNAFKQLFTAVKNEDIPAFTASLKHLESQHNDVGRIASFLRVIFSRKNNAQNQADSGTNSSQQDPKPTTEYFPGDSSFPSDWTIGHKMSFGGALAVLGGAMLGMEVAPAAALLALGGVVVGGADLMNDKMREGSMDDLFDMVENGASKMLGTVTVSGAPMFVGFSIPCGFLPQTTSPFSILYPHSPFSPEDALFTAFLTFFRRCCHTSPLRLFCL